jgi:hypothetical protein
MRKTVWLSLVAVMVAMVPWLHGQDQKAEIQKRLVSQFTLTKTTANKNDIAAAGTVLVLHKDGLLMYAISNPIPPQSTYKKGKITRNALGGNFFRDLGNTMLIPGSSVDIAQRNFVDGGKFWVTNVDVKDDGVIFSLYSDPHDGTRYFGQLKFPYNKKSIPSADDVQKVIAEVFTVEPGDNSNSSVGATQPNTPTPSSLAFAPIVPPPPPADASTVITRTITLRQTKDQVVATFGQPQKIVNSNTTEMYYYADMKVTFVGGKVTDVQ